MKDFIALQRWLYEGMASGLSDVADGRFPALAAAMGAAVLFGVLHAVMPGHGKTILFSYHLGQKDSLLSSILNGAILALIDPSLPVAFLATATGSASQGETLLDDYAELGGPRGYVVPVFDAAAAQQAENHQLLAQAGLIYVGDGDALRLVRALHGSGALDAMAEAFRGGAVVVGMGAGAAALGAWVVVEGAEPGGEPGWGWVPDAVVAPGFGGAEHAPALRAALRARPGVVGVGIPVGVALALRASLRNPARRRIRAGTPSAANASAHRHDPVCIAEPLTTSVAPSRRADALDSAGKLFRRRRGDTILLVLWAGVYLASCLPFVINGRRRVVVVAVLAPLAGMALQTAWRWGRQRRLRDLGTWFAPGGEDESDLRRQPGQRRGHDGRRC